MAPITYTGCSMFRERIATSLLSGKAFRVNEIRSEYIAGDQQTRIGLQDFEASFLRLVDKITDGTQIEINETGTTLKFKPGIIIGGDITHDCGNSRSIGRMFAVVLVAFDIIISFIISGVGWFIEGILPLICFGKASFNGQFTGITNDDVDISVDTIRG